MSRVVIDTGEARVHRFTFGSDHRLPDYPDRPLLSEYVEVIAPRAHRELFMAYLGSNKFSSEYDPQEWETVAEKHYAGKEPILVVAVGGVNG